MIVECRMTVPPLAFEERYQQKKRHREPDADQNARAKSSLSAAARILEY